MRNPFWKVSAFLLTATAGLLFAQTFQELDDSVRASLEETQRQAAVEQGQAEIERETAAQNAGVAGFGNRISGTINDFSSLFSGFFEASPSGDGQSATVRYRVPRRVLSGAFAITTTLVEAELAESLSETIPEAGRADAVLKLEKELEDLDNMTHSLTWNLENKTFGRSWDSIQDAYIADGLKKARAKGNLPQYQTALAQAISQTNPCDGSLDGFIKQEHLDAWQKQCGDFETDTFELSYLTEAGIDALRQRMSAVYEQTATYSEQWYAAFSALQSSIEEQAAQYAAIRNQLYVTAEYQDRDDLVGRSAFKAKLGIEFGFSDKRSRLPLARFNECRRNAKAAGNPDTCDMQQAVADYLSSTTFKRAERLSFIAEFNRQDEYSNQFLTQLGVEDFTELALEQENTFSLTASYGFNVLADDNGDAKGRWELAIKYEDLPKSANHDDRVVAELAYTAKTSDANNFPLVLRYANHSEFLGETDKQWSAHFGIRYKSLTK